MAVELTTVADDVGDVPRRHRRRARRRASSRTPTTSTTASRSARCARPAGALRCRFGTVNDVHFGEVEAGRIDDHADGPDPAGAARRRRRTRRR